MKKILVFRKFGRLRFVGHLDLMRVFQRALRRAGIPLVYSQGFNPHPLMSFASPLPLGVTGEREIMEIELEEDKEDSVILESLNRELPPGLTILSCRTGCGSKGAAMARVQAAEYEIILPERKDWTALWNDFIGQPEILLMKPAKVKGRKQQVQVNVKPWIFKQSLEDGRRLCLLCACSCIETLKPELLLQAFYQFCDCFEEQFNEQIVRKVLYSGTKDSLIPLEEDEAL